MFFLLSEVYCIAINFPVRTTFTLSHRFLDPKISLSFFSRYLFFYLFFDFFSDHWMFSRILFNLSLFFFFHFSICSCVLVL